MTQYQNVKCHTYFLFHLQSHPHTRRELCVPNVLDSRHFFVVDAHHILPDFQIFLINFLLEFIIDRHCAGLETWFHSIIGEIRALSYRGTPEIEFVELTITLISAVRVSVIV